MLHRPIRSNLRSVIEYSCLETLLSQNAPKLVGLLPLDRILWFVSSVLAGVVIWRLIQLALLSRPFKALALMLATVLLRDLTLLLIPYHSHSYTLAWECTLPIVLVMQMWAGYETLRAVAELYPKLGGLAIRLFLVCLSITVAGCSLGLPFELHRIAGDEIFLRSLFLLQRWVDSWIAGTLILVALFFMRFPAPAKQPPRNLVIHTVLLAVYFAGYSVLFFMENLVPLGSAEISERLQLSLIMLLYILWATCLSVKGQNIEPWPQIDVIAIKEQRQPDARRAASGS